MKSAIDQAVERETMSNNWTKTDHVKYNRKAFASLDMYPDELNDGYLNEEIDQEDDLLTLFK